LRLPLPSPPTSQHLPSFPTRRSSDLAMAENEGTAGRETGTMRVKRGLAEMLKGGVIMDVVDPEQAKIAEDAGATAVMALERVPSDRKSTRLNSSHVKISYAVFCLKKK